jgi:hypothetical protein
MDTLMMIPGGPLAALWLLLAIVFLFRFRLPVALFLTIAAGAFIFRY